jgi:hypothetical protein
VNVIEDWEQYNLTWENQPRTGDRIVRLPPPQNAFSDYTDINVTDTIQEQLATSSMFGFQLRLQDEYIYRMVILGSYRTATAGDRPTLVVKFRCMV